MKKMLSRAVLATGIFGLCASAANAATFRFSQEIVFALNSNQAPPDQRTIELPRYSGGFALKSITLLAEGRATGTYRIFNEGGRITLTNYDIGAETPITVPTNSSTPSELTLTPVTNFSRIVVNTNEFRVLPLDGRDEQTLSIPTSDFNLFRGTGNLSFPISAAILTNGRLISIPPIENTQLTLLNSTTRLTVIYETVPLEIPERGFNILSLVFCGLAGLALKASAW